MNFSYSNQKNLLKIYGRCDYFAIFSFPFSSHQKFSVDNDGEGVVSSTLDKFAAHISEVRDIGFSMRLFQ